jgi:beta-1,2-mannobiose phosphorylase / 1,2-beta-oligomannan phosphorylase
MQKEGNQMERYAGNPVITHRDVPPSRPDFKVLGVLNPGVARVGDETVLVLRVAEQPVSSDEGSRGSPMFDASTGEMRVLVFRLDDPGCDFSDPRVIKTKERNYLMSMSHLRLARSRDGHHFTIDPRPFLAASNEYETYGIEDARVTRIDDTYYVNYSAISDAGIVTALASTRDFVEVHRLGNIFHPDNKDTAIFPEKIGGLYYALHRPSTSEFGKPEIWLAQSPDLLCWGNHRRIATVRDGWDSARIGASAVPFRTSRGWVEIYHGATKENRYCLGAMLLKADEPWVVLALSERPLVEPMAPYETEGFFGNVVFCCGATVEGDDVRIYYGAADESVACIDVTVREILDNLGVP